MSKKTLTGLREYAKRLALSDDWGSEAIAANTRIIELNEQAADAYTRLAKCFLSQGNMLTAYDMYRQVLEFEPNNTIAAYGIHSLQRVIAKELELRDVASIESYDEAFSVGVAARRRGNVALAIVALKRALELYPGSIYACNALAAAYRRGGMPMEATHTYQRALEMTPNTASLVGLAAVARDNGQTGEAIELYKKVLSSEPRNAYALNGLGGVYTDMGDYSTAENYFNRASKVDDGIDEAVKGLEKIRFVHKKNGNADSVERIGRWLLSLGVNRF